MEDKSLIKDAGKMVGSGVFVQVVAFLLIILLGRLYNEEQMGTLGLFLAWAGLLSITSGGRYEHAIVVSNNEDDASTLFSLSILINGGCFVILLPICLGINFLLPSTHYSRMQGYILLLPLFVLLQGIVNSLCMLRLYQKHYNKLSLSQALQGLSNNLLKVLLGLRMATVASLIGASFMALILGGIPLLRFQSNRRALTLDKGRLKQAATRYANFPRYGILQALIDNLLGSLFILMLPLSYSIKEVGILTMAITLARRPLQIIGDNLSRVYYQRLSEKCNQRQELFPMIKKFAIRWICLSIPVFGILALFMEKLVVAFVGPLWGKTGFVIVAMLPMLIPNFLNMIFNIIPDVLGKQKINMNIQIGMIIFESIIIGLGLWLMSFDEIIPFYYLFVCIEQSVFFIILIRLAREHDTTIRQHHIS